MEKDAETKMDNKNAVVLETVREGRIMLELIRKTKRNWLGHWLRRNCLLKDAVECMVGLNGKKVRGRRRHQMIDNIMLNGLYEDTKRKSAKRVDILLVRLIKITQERITHIHFHYCRAYSNLSLVKHTGNVTNAHNKLE